MKILLVTFGSRGDLNPFLGLGLALKKRGTDVTLITWDIHEEIIKREGLNFIAAGGSYYQEMLKMDSADWYHPLKGMQLVSKYIFLGMMRPTYDILKQFDPQSTLIVSHPIAFGARIAAEKLNMPLVSICLQPSMLWSEQQPVYTSSTFVNKLPLFLRRNLLKLIDKYFLDRLYMPELNKFRAELGLKKVNKILSSWSVSPDRIIGFFPEWFANASDWPAQTKLAGFTLYDEEADKPLSPELQQFLAAGDAPLVFTYGSMMKQGHEFFAASIAAVQKLGCRAILLTQTPEQLPAFSSDKIMHVSYVPFRKLLPQVAGLIHHGGIGTTMQAIAAGIPQMIVPLLFDQPDNAERVVKLGLGISVPREKYSVENAMQNLQRLMQCEKIKKSCNEYQKKINFAEAEQKVVEWVLNGGLRA